MNAEELREIYQSDFKLWERANTEEDGIVITKSLHLPYGIGEFTLGFEGVKDAAGRRNAAGVWGQAVRDAIDDAIGEDSVTARAAQKAPRVSEGDGGHGGLGQPNPYDAGQEEVPEKEAIPSFSGAAAGSTAAGDRLDALRRERDGCAKRIKGLDIEIKALQAYVEVMNAQEVSDEESRGTSSESTEVVS